MSLSPGRFLAVLVKEFIPMRRDRVTFAMMIGLPPIQLLLFGFAISGDPHQGGAFDRCDAGHGCDTGDHGGDRAGGDAALQAD